MVSKKHSGKADQLTLAIGDREQRTQFLVMFNCRDSEGLTSMAEIRIAVEPFNDNSPEFQELRRFWLNF